MDDHGLGLQVAMSEATLSVEPLTAAEQACAIPFRRKHERVEFCLITSTRGHWLFPKGYIDPGQDPAKTAVKEAYEEAGLRGQIEGQPLGCYRTPKNGSSVAVLVLLMRVQRTESDWPEHRFRERRWVTQDEACRLLQNPQLVELLNAAATRISGE